jgi:hypothetical protein
VTSAWSSRGARAEPIRRLGGASPGGLALPPAAPTPGQLYAPRGVWTDGRRVVVADTGNHRILVWHTWPDRDGAGADVVIGQPDMTTEGPAAACGDLRRGLNLPTGVAVVGGDLVVADAWHHRVLVYEGLPTTDFPEPRAVLGQARLEEVEPNRGGVPGLGTFYWPFGFGVVGATFWVTDTGNRRILGWHGHGVPDPARPADILLGQDSSVERVDNRGATCAASFRWPHSVAGDDATLYVADAGDHRILGWSPPPAGDAPASLVLGQADMASIDEFKNRPQGADRLRFPYSVVSDESRVVVADTSNNRILVWHGLPREGVGAPADTVLGQPDMAANGENRWSAVTDDSLCWPYGLSLAGDVLAVADSGNNRVVLWRLEAPRG